MAYDDLDDDVLILIALNLEYFSLLSWSQTSRRHRSLLFDSKQAMLAMVRNWNFPVPLSLPIHMTEGGLATRDLHLAIQRAVLSNRFWNKPYMNSTLFKQTPLAFQRDFPGSRLLSTVYFDNPGLVILLLNDGDTGQGGKYITLYQVSPPEKLAVWDSGEGEVCSWAYQWVDMGSRFKQLVIAASIKRPGWHNLATRNSLEVSAIDLEPYFEGSGSPVFQSMAKCYWRDAFTSVVISDTLVGGLVYMNKLPIVVTFMDWRTGHAESVLVDATSHYFPAEIEDLTSHIRFRAHHVGYAQIVLLQDWIGIIQLAANDIAGCLLFPTLFNSPTVHLSHSFPPFKLKRHLVAIGHSSNGGMVEPIKDGAAVMSSRLHDPTALRVMTAIDIPFDGERYEVKTIDFSTFKAQDTDVNAYSPGFHRLAPVQVRNRDLGSVWLPIVGVYAFAMAYMAHQPRQPGQSPDHEQLTVSRVGDHQAEMETCVLLPQQEFSGTSIEPLILDEAAAVICVLHAETQELWFLHLCEYNNISQ